MMKEPGHFGLYAGDSLLQILAWNYSRDESVLTFYTDEIIENQLKEIGFDQYEIFKSEELKKTDVLDRVVKGTQLWKLFLIFALFFCWLNRWYCACGNKVLVRKENGRNQPK